GGRAVAEVWILAPSAGINPAPQIPRPLEIGGGAGPCGAGFTPASGGGAVAEVWISAPQAGINPAPQVPRPGLPPRTVPAGSGLAAAIGERRGFDTHAGGVNVIQDHQTQRHQPEHQ